MLHRFAKYCIKTAETSPKQGPDHGPQMVPTWYQNGPNVPGAERKTYILFRFVFHFWGPPTTPPPAPH